MSFQLAIDLTSPTGAAAASTEVGPSLSMPASSSSSSSPFQRDQGIASPSDPDAAAGRLRQHRKRRRRCRRILDLVPVHPSRAAADATDSVDDEHTPSLASPSEEELPRERPPIRHRRIRLDTNDAASTAADAATVDGVVTVTLGRNARTDVRDPSVSRALCDVSLSSSLSSSSTYAASVVNYEQEDISGVSSSSSSSSTSSGSGGAACCCFLQMRKAPGMHRVEINGVRVTAPVGRPMPLRSGSILTLFGSKYGYRVDLIEDAESTLVGNEGEGEGGAQENRTEGAQKSAEGEGGEEENKEDGKLPSSSVAAAPELAPASTAASSSTDANPHAERNARTHRIFHDELTCPVCMELLVKTVAAYPCGHAVCGPCAEGLIDAHRKSGGPAGNTRRRVGFSAAALVTGSAFGGGAVGPVPSSSSSLAPSSSPVSAQCPSCRVGVTAWTPLCFVDTLVWATCLTGSVDADDAQHYLDRCGKVPTDEERRLIFPNGGDGADGSGGNEGGSSSTMAAGMPAVDTATNATLAGGDPPRMPLSSVASASAVDAAPSRKRGAPLPVTSTDADAALARLRQRRQPLPMQQQPQVLQAPTVTSYVTLQHAMPLPIATMTTTTSTMRARRRRLHPPIGGTSKDDAICLLD